MIKHSFIASAFLVISLSSSVLAETTSYMSDKTIKIYKNPSDASPSVKSINAGQIIEGTGESVKGYIPIIGGYAKESELMPFRNQSNGEKSMRVLVENTFSSKEVPVEYSGTVTANKVNLRSCASVKCDSTISKSKGDTLAIIAKTTDGAWYKVSPSNSYVSSKYIHVEFNSSAVVETPDKEPTKIVAPVVTKEPIRQQNLPKEERIELEVQKSTISFENTPSETSNELLAHSGELAKKYENDAMIKNLTKTATPMPVKIPARYARALDFPILNKSGDVYTDYTYVWIKIKNEEFVLGKREGKTTDGQFTINKRTN